MNAPSGDHAGALFMLRLASKVKRELTDRSRSIVQRSTLELADSSKREAATWRPSGDRAMLRQSSGSPTVDRSFPARSNHDNRATRPRVPSLYARTPAADALNEA